jgi:hypothetical protein
LTTEQDKVIRIVKKLIEQKDQKCSIKKSIKLEKTPVFVKKIKIAKAIF